MELQIHKISRHGAFDHFVGRKATRLRLNLKIWRNQFFYFFFSLSKQPWKFFSSVEGATTMTSSFGKKTRCCVFFSNWPYICSLAAADLWFFFSEQKIVFFLGLQINHHPCPRILRQPAAEIISLWEASHSRKMRWERLEWTSLSLTWWFGKLFRELNSFGSGFGSR